MPRRSVSLIALMAALAAPARGASVEAEISADNDPVLGALVREALEKSPEYARARADTAAERERVPQAGALPDPTLTLGIQNDGFKSIEIGTMETSFWQVMLTQPLPWPGKRGLREGAARTQASAVEARVERIRLSTTAAVERAYLELLLVRGQISLLRDLEALWKEAEAIARARYEVGAVPQSDVLRAQLERTRLVQQQVGLDSSERVIVQTLNRLRVHPLDESIETSRLLPEVSNPTLGTSEESLADAELRSPDLIEARLIAQAAQDRVAVARRDRFPDFTVSAGVMPRGGLDPMWQASVGISLPIFSASKQSRAVAESTYRQDSAQQGEEAMRQMVRLRARERHTALEAALRTIQIYREGLLVQSDAAVRSTLVQYKVGKVPFLSVLEVMRGFILDQSGYLRAIAEAQRIAVARREVSLDPAGSGAAALSSGTSVPGASAGMGGGASARSGGGTTEPSAAPSGGSGMSSGM